MSTTGAKEFGGTPPTIDELRVELARQRAEAQATREQARELAEGQRQIQSLYLLTDRLQRASAIEDIYTAALDAILSGLRCDRASILLYDDSSVMRFVAWRGLSEEYRRAAEGHSPWRPDDREPTPIGFGNIEDVELDPRLAERIRLEGIRAAAFIPLVSDGRLIGKFMTYFDSLHEFSDASSSRASSPSRCIGTAPCRPCSQRSGSSRSPDAERTNSSRCSRTSCAIRWRRSRTPSRCWRATRMRARCRCRRAR
jgi:hypothetical protein